MPHRSRPPPPGFAALPPSEAGGAAPPAAGGVLGRGKPDLAALKQERAQQKQRQAELKLQRQQERQRSSSRARSGGSAAAGAGAPSATTSGAASGSKNGKKKASAPAGAGMDDSEAFSTTSGSSSDAGKDSDDDDEEDGNSSDEEQRAALEMDGQELWALNYCAICDRLIEPGTGVTANGAVLGTGSAGSGAGSGTSSVKLSSSAGAGATAGSGGAAPAALKKAIDDLKRSTTTTAAAGVGGARPGLKRAGSSGSRINALSDLKPMIGRAEGQQTRHHVRTPSGGSTASKGRKSPAGYTSRSRNSSQTRAKGGKAGANTQEDEDDLACSPVSARSGIATPPGTGSGLIRAKEEAKAAKRKSRERGSSLLGPLTPMMLKEQEELEKAKAKAPQALYCSVECRKIDEARSKDLSALSPYLHPPQPAASPEHQIWLNSQFAASTGSGGAGFAGSYSGATTTVAGPSSFAYAHQSLFSQQQHTGGPPYSPGGDVAPAPPWAQMPFGPNVTSSNNSMPTGSFSTSWQNHQHHLMLMMTARPGSANRFTGPGSQVGSYPYPYDGYRYPTSSSAVVTPDECDCAECRAAIAGRASSRAANTTAAVTSSNNGTIKKEIPDYVSLVPSGASDTTESSGGYPYGPMAPSSGTKKRTQSGRVETPLNLHPSHGGDYFNGHHHQQQQRQQQNTGSSAEEQKRLSLGAGSASTNVTDDSTLSYWESKQRRYKGSKEEERSEVVEADSKEAKSQDPFSWSKSSTSQTASTSLSSSQLASNSPLRLLKHRGGSSSLQQRPVAELVAAGVLPETSTSLSQTQAHTAGGQTSTSLNNASGFLSRSMASEYTELGTSATTTGTYNVQRSSTIRGPRSGSKGKAPLPQPESALLEEQQAHTADPVVATSQAPAIALTSSSLNDRQRLQSLDGTLDALEEDAEGGMSSAINTLRKVQARGSDFASSTHHRSRTSLSGLWPGGSFLDVPPAGGSGRESRRMSFATSESGQSVGAGSLPSSTSGYSSGSGGWWRSLVPAWASIKALQAFSNSADSDDDSPAPSSSQDNSRRSSAGVDMSRSSSRIDPLTPASQIHAAPGVVRPAARRAEVPAYAHEIGHGHVPGDARETSPEEETEVRAQRRAERERAHKHQRSKDIHVLPPLLAPSRSSTNLRIGHSRTSRTGSASYARTTNPPIASPMFGSFGAARSTTPLPLGTTAPAYAAGYVRSTTPASNVIPPSPGLRAVRSPARASFGNLAALGDPMMRPPSRTGSAMGMHVGSLSASPRRAGLGWGPISQNPAYNDPAAFAYAPSPRPGVQHSHSSSLHHRHHHHHHHPGIHHRQGSSHDLSGGHSSDEQQVSVGDKLPRPGSGMGYRVTAQRPKSVYGTSYGHDSALAQQQIPVSMAAAGGAPARTWSYERMPGLKTYPVMQLANRKPTHDVYDSGWNDVLASKPLADDLQEDPAEEAKADTDQAAAALQASESSRKRLFYFAGDQPS